MNKSEAERVRERVISTFLDTQQPRPQLVAWQTLAEMTGTPVRVCRRILDDADGVTYLLARNDAEGAMVARYREEGDALTARLGRDIARLEELADTRALVLDDVED